MNRVSYIGWLAGQAAGGLRFLWPVTLALMCLLAVAVFWDSSRAKLRFNLRIFYLFLPALGTVLILLFGSLFEHRPSMVYLPYVAFGVAVILGILTAGILKPAWMTSVSASLCLLWYSFWCWFVSVMSITGDWL